MNPEIELARQITDSQRQIYGYFHSLVGKSAASWDILQETNLVLWRKREEAGKVRNFDAWAFTIARFQVMAYLRDRKREPLDVLTPELVEQFAGDSEQVTADMADRLKALRGCKKRLGTKSRRLIELYYENGLSLAEIGAHLDSNSNALKQALHRIRSRAVSSSTAPTFSAAWSAPGSRRRWLRQHG